MFNKISGNISLVAFSGLAAIAPSISSADEISLTFEQQGVTIAGEYAGFRDNAYVVVTSAGVLHIPANLVTCEGADCLEILSPAQQDS